MGVQAGGAGAKVDSIVVGQMASEVERCIEEVKEEAERLGREQAEVGAARKDDDQAQIAAKS